MEGCISNLVKYLLFTTNFLIFVLGIAVFGLGIWVVVDEPSFLDLFKEAQNVAPEITDGFNVEIYTSAVYILLVVSALVVLVSFFGCCGAFKENKCMLGTYFTLILAMFIVMVVGAVLGYSGDLDKAIKDPLKSALSKYKDDVTETNPLFAYKAAWNTVQEELKCCGVDDVTDWSGIEFQWDPETANKPSGCCMVRQDGETMADAEKETCRSLPLNPENAIYYYRGCYSMIKNEIEENQNLVVGVTLGVVAVMFLNMIYSLAMCTMVK